MYQRLFGGQRWRLLSCFLCGFGAGFEAVAVVAGFQDVASVCKPVEKGGCHLCIAEDLGPFREAEVGGNHRPQKLFPGTSIEIPEKYSNHMIEVRYNAALGSKAIEPENSSMWP